MKIPLKLSQKFEESRPQVEFVPANLFFCKTIDLPEEMEVGDIPAFAELAMEELSPFPLEHIAWGFFRDLELRKAFLYAAWKPRVAKRIFAEDANLDHVFPSFIALNQMRPDQPSIAGFWHENVVTAAYYDGDSPFPSKLVHKTLLPVDRPVEEDAEESNISGSGADEDGASDELSVAEALIAYETLVGELKQADENVEAGLNRIESVDRSHRDFVTIEVLRYISPESDPTPSAPVTMRKGVGLWAADLHDSEFIQRERRSRELEGKLWTAVVYGSWVALFILVINVLYGAGNLWIGIQERTVAAQAPAAFEISDSKIRLEKLEQFAGGQFRPFDVLRALNQYRPKNIYFKSTTAEEDFQVNVQGYANSVDAVNQYSDKLRSSAYFKAVRLANVTTRRGQVNFSLQLTFQEEQQIPEELASK